MRANMWNRALVILGLVSLSVQAAPPAAQEPGTRVTVRLAEASGQMPEPERVVESLEAAGGEHHVRVKRQRSSGMEELTVELWGATVPQADIPQTLREAFPVLAAADIQVASIDAKERPKFEKEEGRVKKVVKIIKKE